MLEFIHQLVAWIESHPHLAGLVVGLASCFESLAFVGLLVPGAVIMFAAGALISNGAMAFWPTMAWGVVGAIIGDGSSYLLGRHYHEHIRQLWPFRRYPEMLTRGERFFHRHGTKSILLGRFVGPVRPVVPVVAGMLGMPALRFYLSNVLSALGWAPAYLIMGMAFGDSLMLAGEVAGRLALLLGATLLAVWGIAGAIHRLYLWIQPHVSQWVEHAMHRGENHRMVRWLVADLVDPERPGIRALFIWLVLLVAGTWLFLDVLRGVLSQNRLVVAGESVYQFLQGLRTMLGDHIMVACSGLGSWPVLGSVAVVVLVWLLWRRQWSDALYWLVVIAFSGLTVVALKGLLHVSRPLPLFSDPDSYNFPSAHVTISTAVYGLLAVLSAQAMSLRWRWWPYAFAALIVSSVAFARLYLGAHWLADVVGGLSLGMIWVALVAIVRQRHEHGSEPGLAMVALVAIGVAGGWYLHTHLTDDMKRYAVRHTEQHMAASSWWQTSWQDLPAYLIDLEGKEKQPLNLQWAGRLSAIRTLLLAQGWHQPLEVSLRTAPNWLLPQPALSKLPVPPQLHNGQPDVLRLVHRVDGGHGQMILRLWPADVFLQPDNVPLWVGTVTRQRIQHLPLITILRNAPAYDQALADLEPMLGGLVSKRVQRHADGLRHMAGWQGHVLLLGSGRLRLQ